MVRAFIGLLVPIGPDVLDNAVTKLNDWLVKNPFESQGLSLLADG